MFLKLKFFRFVSEIYHLKPPLINLNNSIQKQGTNVKTEYPYFVPFMMCAENHCRVSNTNVSNKIVREKASRRTKSLSKSDICY